jgi:ribosomal protein S18 acetylase RimI-like enzyme
MNVLIRSIQVEDAIAFRKCLDSIARERKYLAQIEAMPIDQIVAFIKKSVAQNVAQYVALVDKQVVGWCDVFPHWAYAHRHVGTLGMGVHRDFRGQGIGRKLLLATLAHAAEQGIYRVTLEAREDNTRAIRLYESAGFRHEARTSCALRFDGVFYAGVQMALLQGPAI